MEVTGVSDSFSSDARDTESEPQDSDGVCTVQFAVDEFDAFPFSFEQDGGVKPQLLVEHFDISLGSLQPQKASPRQCGGQVVKADFLPCLDAGKEHGQLAGEQFETGGFFEQKLARVLVQAGSQILQQVQFFFLMVDEKFGGCGLSGQSPCRPSRARCL